jgi:hypothetical protein
MQRGICVAWEALSFVHGRTLSLILSFLLFNHSFLLPAHASISALTTTMGAVDLTSSQSYLPLSCDLPGYPLQLRTPTSQPHSLQPSSTDYTTSSSSVSPTPSPYLDLRLCITRSIICLPTDQVIHQICASFNSRTLATTLPHPSPCHITSLQKT